MHPDSNMHRVLLAASQITLNEPVRGYEMGREGCVPFSGFARFCEHMRWELGRRGHVNDPQMPKRGVVRAQTHRFLEKLRYPNTWTGTTQLVHVGGSSMHFGHMLTNDQGRVLAQARTVIVLLDESNRPASAPGYLRDYADASFEAPNPLVAPDPTWTNPVTYAVTVRSSDHDSFGHVNQARYIDFVDDARIHAGLGRIRGISLSYDQEARAGDTLLVQLGPAQTDASPDVRYAFRMLRESDEVVIHRGVLEVAPQAAR
jgi:acyl-CoA thioesterase FadM